MDRGEGEVPLLLLGGDKGENGTHPFNSRPLSVLHVDGAKAAGKAKDKLVLFDIDRDRRGVTGQSSTAGHPRPTHSI